MTAGHPAETESHRQEGIVFGTACPEQGRELASTNDYLADRWRLGQSSRPLQFVQPRHLSADRLDGLDELGARLSPLATPLDAVIDVSGYQ